MPQLLTPSRAARTHATGSSLVATLVGVAVLAIVMVGFVAVTQHAKQMLEIKRVQNKKMIIRNHLRGRLSCPFTLGNIPTATPPAPGAEVPAFEAAYDDSWKPTYIPLPFITPGAYATIEGYQVRLVYESGPTPVKLRPQVRATPTSPWEDLLADPYLVCEYGPGVLAYRRAKGR
jgi:hypothetical protein